MKNPYSILGLSADASAEEAKIAFRKLAKKYHPDINSDPDAKDKFSEITQAYDQIINPPRQNGFGFDDQFDQFSDINEFIRRQFAQRPNHDIGTMINLTLEQVFTGCEVEVKVGMNTHKINVPRGLDENQRLCIQRAGRTDNPKMPPGDLYIQVRNVRNPNFERQGENLIHRIKLDALEAIVGSIIRAPTIDGDEIDVEIPAGIQHHEHVIVPDRGLYLYNESRRGFMAVVIEIEIPRTLTEHHRALIDQMEERLPIRSDIS